MPPKWRHPGGKSGAPVQQSALPCTRTCIVGRRTARDNESDTATGLDKEPPADDRQIALDALAHLDLSRADDREQWIEIGMALHSVSPALYAEWDRWSQQSEKYNAKDAQTVWRSFKPGGGIRIGTLIAKARDDDPSWSPREQKKSSATRQGVIQYLSTLGRLNGFWSYGPTETAEEFEVHRIEVAKGKDFRPVHRDKQGQWHVASPPGPLPLYNREGLAAAGDVSPVFLVEGEKCADAATAIGLTATTSAHGADGVGRADWSALTHRNVVVLPDRDKSGERYASKAQGHLAKLPGTTVKVVRLPDLGEGEDIVEFIEHRRAAGKADNEIRDEILALVAAEPEDEAEPEPSPKKPSPPVAFRPFPTKCLPPPLARFVRRAAAAIGCDESFIVGGLLPVLSVCIGISRVIQLKKSWWEPVVIWLAIIAESGMQKSPAYDVVMRALKKLQAKLFKEYEQALARYDQEVLVYKKALSHWTKDKSDRPPPVAPPEPVNKRLFSGDTTIEGLRDLLVANPRGHLNARDELAGWARSFDAYRGGKGSDVAHWLEAHRAGEWLFDRSSKRQATRIPHAFIALCGTIQPGIFARVVGEEYRENGLLARVLAVMPPRRKKRWSEDDLDEDVVEELEKVLEGLLALELDVDPETGDPVPRQLPLTPSGRTAFIRFYNEHADEAFELTGDLAAAWAKLEGYAARFALIIHGVRVVIGDPTLEDPEAVDKASVDAAVTITRWFCRETERVYGALQEPEDARERRRLVEIIQGHGGRCTVRQFMQWCRKYRGSAEEAEAALNDLAEAGLGSWETLPTKAKGGRQKKVFVVADDGGGNTTPDSEGGVGNGTPAPDASAGVVSPLPVLPPSEQRRELDSYVDDDEVLHGFSAAEGSIERGGNETPAGSSEKKVVSPTTPPSPSEGTSSTKPDPGNSGNGNRTPPTALSSEVALPTTPSTEGVVLPPDEEWGVL